MGVGLLCKNTNVRRRPDGIPSIPEKSPESNTLLFVDDEPTIRLTLPLIFKENGFQVSVVESVSLALLEITNRKFDVLVSDLNICEPGDGLSVLKAARKSNPTCICVVLTGFPDDESRAQSLAAGADAYFIKPAAIEKLLQSIRERKTF
jgi:DNA-binding response OmpR family regulator